MIDLPTNAAGRLQDGKYIAFSCTRCQEDACYWTGLQWLCTDHHIEEQTRG